MCNTKFHNIRARCSHNLAKKIYNMKLHNIRARSTRAEKYITRNSTIPERVPHAEKYNTALGPIPHHFYYFLLFETCTHNEKKNGKKNFIQYKNTTRKIRHAYNTLIQHAYNTKFIQHKKYSIKWAYHRRVKISEQTNRFLS